jgi:hypothetical protein
MRHLLLTVFLCVAAGLPAGAQARAPRPFDVSTMDGALAALYAGISGNAGEARDWERWKTLFVPGARLIPVTRSGGAVATTVMSPDEFIARVTPAVEKEGFFEREIARTVETFGAATHVFSTYESRRAMSDPKPFARGINSIQMLNDGQRWWIVTVYWDAESTENPLPGKYLPR